MSSFHAKGPQGQGQQASRLLTMLHGSNEVFSPAGVGDGKPKRPRNRGGKNRGSRSAAAPATTLVDPDGDEDPTHPAITAAAAIVDDDDDDDLSLPVAAEATQSHLTTHEFSSLPVSQNTKRGLAEGLKYRYMSKVQHMSIPECITGKDALVKAKTGTGKTLAFLIPAIENLMAEKQRSARSNGPAPRLLVLSPTRELASQIMAEGKLLCTFHKLGLVLFVGGTNMNSDVRNINKPVDGYSDIIVATPGRLVAHINDTPGFAAQLVGVKVFVLDEADRLLDMGFERDLTLISNCLKKRPVSMPPRQTLLFSATVSREVQKIAQATLRTGHCFVDCVGEEGEEEQTHAHVPQHAMVVPMNIMLRAVVHAIEQHILANPNDYKIIAFLGTAREAQFYANLINQLGLECLEIHSRLSQSKRTKCSDEFRKKKRVILFSSDVSARGMDYPDVSFVLQIGSTSLEQYIHRLGRTARAGKGGTGMLLLSDYESSFMINKELKTMPLVHLRPPAELLEAANDYTPRQRRLRETLSMLHRMDSEEKQHGEDSFVDQARMAWGAWLGATNSMLRKLNMDKNDLVALSNHYFASIGLSQMPALQAKTVGKMGLKGVAGLRIEKGPAQQQGGGRGGGGNRGGTGGGNAGAGAAGAVAAGAAAAGQAPPVKRGGGEGDSSANGPKRHRGGSRGGGGSGGKSR